MKAKRESIYLSAMPARQMFIKKESVCYGKEKFWMDGDIRHLHSLYKSGTREDCTKS